MKTPGLLERYKLARIDDWASDEATTKEYSRPYSEYWWGEHIPDVDTGPMRTIDEEATGGQ